MRIALKIEYKGTRYHGFEHQKSNIPTIQQNLEAALSLVADEKISLTVAGRTDKGVHAIGQVIHFDTNKNRAINAWVRGVNSHLPQDISVLNAKVVSDDFNARFSAISRTYHYRIINRPERVSIESELGFWVCQTLNVEKMQTAANYLLGEHNFSAFRAASCQANNPNRHLSLIKIVRNGENIITKIKGNAFLHHMVRNIMGTLLEVGVGKKPVKWVKEVLESNNRNKAGATIAARGLTLISVAYPDDLFKVS